MPQAAGFFLLPIYTHYLSPADYGIVNAMQVLGAILLVLFTLAIDRSIYRLYFDYKTDKGKKDFLGTVTISFLLISISVLLLLFVFRGIVGQIYSSIDFYPFYVYAIFTTFFSVFALIPKIYFQINEKAGKYVLISVSEFILSTVFVLWFIIEKGDGAKGMLMGKMIGSIVILPLLIYISIRNINFTFKKQIFKESLHFSLPLIPGLLSAWILGLSDRIFIERYFDLHDVGIYSLGYKIAGLVVIFSNAFLKAYTPAFYKFANTLEEQEAKQKLYKYNHVYIMVVMVVVFLIALFSKELIQLLLDPKYINAYKIVPIICVAYLISQASGLFNLMIYQEKKVKQLMYIGLSAASLNILLNFLLVPKFGAFGAAYATVISFIIVFAVSWAFAKKAYYIPFKWSQIIPLLILIFGVYLTFYFINIQNIYLELFYKLLTISVIGSIYFFRNKEEIYSFIKLKTVNK